MSFEKSISTLFLGMIALVLLLRTWIPPQRGEQEDVVTGASLVLIHHAKIKSEWNRFFHKRATATNRVEEVTGQKEHLGE